MAPTIRACRALRFITLHSGSMPEAPAMAESFNDFTSGLHCDLQVLVAHGYR
jgi:hypothetical protein